MSAVRALMNALQTRTGARWVNTGGGCMAVQVEFGPLVGINVWKYEILITGRDDVFGRNDLHSNEEVSGFLAILRPYDPEEGLYPDERAVTVYQTAEDAGVCPALAWGDARSVDLAAEVDRCVVAVENVVEMVLSAERVGRDSDRFRGWLSV